MAGPADGPDARAARLERLTEQLAAGLSAAQQQQVLRYLEQLQRWNQTYNLTALRDEEALWSQHLADCLAVLPALDRQIRAGRLLDVGSGGGLPGALLAIARPALQVSCIDAVGKKAAFVRQLASVLGLPNLRALHGRVEALTSPGFDLITSRAFASLADFTRLTQALLSPQGVWMAMKGRRPDDEIAALPDRVAVFHVEPLSVPGLAAERCLVWMRPSSQRPPAQSSQGSPT